MQGRSPMKNGGAFAGIPSGCFRSRTRQMTRDRSPQVEPSIEYRLLAFGFREIAVLFQLFKISFRFGLQS
jgi:hypothetical protein